VVAAARRRERLDALAAEIRACVRHLDVTCRVRRRSGCIPRRRRGAGQQRRRRDRGRADRAGHPADCWRCTRRTCSAYCGDPALLPALERGTGGQSSSPARSPATSSTRAAGYTRQARRSGVRRDAATRAQRPTDQGHRDRAGDGPHEASRSSACAVTRLPPTGLRRRRVPADRGRHRRLHRLRRHAAGARQHRPTVVKPLAQAAPHKISRPLELDAGQPARPQPHPNRLSTRRGFRGQVEQFGGRAAPRWVRASVLLRGHATVPRPRPAVPCRSPRSR